MDFKAIYELKRNLGHLSYSDLEKFTKDELIEFIIKSHCLEPHHERFTLFIVTDGRADYMAKKITQTIIDEEYEYTLIGVVGEYGTSNQYWRPFKTLKYAKADNIRILREPDDYNEYLKQFGL